MPGQSYVSKDQTVINRLIYWAKGKEDIRAMLLTSSRSNPYLPVDDFSDYDIILAVTDFPRYLENDDWLEDFGRVLTVYRDPVKIGFSLPSIIRVTQYEDGTKIDYSVWPVELLMKIAGEPELPPSLDIGYRVLLDKDSLTEKLKIPTYRAYMPSIPTDSEYHTLAEEFFCNTFYVAKFICRDELLPLKCCLDYLKQDKLRQMLEWRMEIDHNWLVKPGALGKGLKKYINPGIWSELENTYVGAGTAENWGALFKTIEIFHKVASEVAGYLGYSYPQELEQRVLRYLQGLRAKY